MKERYVAQDLQHEDIKIQSKGEGSTNEYHDLKEKDLDRS